MRIISRLDVKPPYVVKPVHFEGLRKMGIPDELATKYYTQGADEIFYIDIVSSLYRREILYPGITDTANKVFVPFAVGGGVRSIDDFGKLLHSGADKVVINTYALQENPDIIDEAAKTFGSQAVVVHIQAKKWDHWYECYSDCGRIRSNKHVTKWAKEVEERGAGEILLSSIDTDGKQKGFDLQLIKDVVNTVNIPVVAGSGAGSLEDIRHIATEAKPDGIAIASLLHYNKTTITEIKEYLTQNGIGVAL